MLKKDKQDLSAYIQKTIKQLATNKKIKVDMINTLKNRVSINKLSDLFLFKEDEYVLLNSSEIYWVTKYLINNKSKFDYIFNVSLEEYFTDKEQSEAELYIIITNEDEEDFLILDNVIKVSDTEYVCTDISYQTIKKFYDTGIINYSFDMQRESTVVNLGVGTIKKPTIYRRNVEKIKEKMKANKFYSNMLTWNILATGEEEFIYESETNRMAFYKNSPVFLIDGMHRTIAITELLEEDPNAEGHMQIKIWNIDVFKAQEFIEQETQGTPISEERRKSLQQNKFMTIAKMINTNGNEDTNVMYNKITDNEDEINKYHTKYCFYSVITNVLEEKFEDILNKPADNRKTADYLIDFFNEYTAIMEDEFENIETSRKYNVATYNNMFIMMTYVAKKLHGDRKWRSKLDNFIKSINFKTDNKLWSNLLITSVRDDKRVRNKIYEFVNNKFKELQLNEENETAMTEA